MFTSRAEHRLLLREDNADLRLREFGHTIGLVQTNDYQRTAEKKWAIEEEIRRQEETSIIPNEKNNAVLATLDSTPLKTPVSLAQILRRPEISFAVTQEISPSPFLISREVAAEVEIAIKYSGYIRRQEEGVERLRHLENVSIPKTLDYKAVQSLSAEVREKLIALQPHSLGQAARIPGVTPAALSILAVHLKRVGAA